jgi:amino acid transporter
VVSFAFIPPTLPSYLSRSISHDNESEQQQHRLGLAEAVALVVGMQIGSGIFSSPGVIVHSTKSVGSSLVVWLVSGILAWTGASSFAELGSAIPLNGGAQAYLAYAVSESLNLLHSRLISCARQYSPFVSYLFCWTAVSALKPGSCAIIALIFG